MYTFTHTHHGEMKNKEFSLCSHYADILKITKTGNSVQQQQQKTREMKIQTLDTIFAHLD